MEDVVINQLTRDGMRLIKVIGDAEISSERYQAAVPFDARSRADVRAERDEMLGLFSLMIQWPVFEPFDFFIFGPKKFRRLMVVHYAFAERVSECIRLARDEFFARTHFTPRDVYLAELPKGAEMWTSVHGCILQVAEWMPARCVAVGGRDD